MSIASTSAPVEIRGALTSLSNSIDFTREDKKAANGYVFFGRNRITDVTVAVKFYYWGGRHEYHAEPKQLAAIASEHVLPIHDAGVIDDKYAYFITPDCSKGDLDDVLEQTSIGNLAGLEKTYQVLSGLSHLHERRFLHRDLKPSNIYLTEQGVAVIGDFGSVKRLPENVGSIPASSHSLLYRPPESIVRNAYGIAGDIYQTGVVFYQLLGGFLPYDGLAYLSRGELHHYEAMSSPRDRGEYIDQCIKGKITAGKLLRLNSLPAWVPDSFKRIIKKACHVDESKRFSSASSFMAKLHELRPTILDWQVIDGLPCLFHSPTSYRLTDLGHGLGVQKRRGGEWRNDHSFDGTTINELVLGILAVV
ncbi:MULTISPECIES: protein kinase domain-containing protein [unclassified Caballeronia]|uniref:serine/threonine protein kinase n=1 Tax=unclassified Caballeronia TaxID=2646786 RepID=UPI0020287F8E|nr:MULTISPECIES: protein kinase [unclassified Caballeronia]MDR5766153.1 protein kinase [Caballeronia sp. LZ028]